MSEHQGSRAAVVSGSLRAALILLAAVSPSPGQARELEKAPVRESVQPCPSYGSGFVRVPGSPTCVRVSGRVRTGADLAVGQDVAAAPMAAGRLAIDTRTESDFGPVRTYVRIGNGRR